MAPTIARRLARLRVTRPAASPAGVVEHLLAIQAQDLGAALWAVGLRCGATRAGVEAAIDAGGIVRTWPMRGTLHLVPAADVRWLLALLGPRMETASARRMRELDLDRAMVDRCAAHADRALAGVRSSREDLLAGFEAIGVSTAGQRGYHLLCQLALQGVICQVGAAFVRFDDVVPEHPTLDRDEALVRLARRYFAGHGPATEADLAWWAGLPLKDVRAGIAGADLVRDGDLLDIAPDDPPPAGVHLLPAFDEWLLGYRDRSATLDPAWADRVCPGGNGIFRPIVVVDGRTVGTWRAKTTRQGVALAFEAFDGTLDPERLAEPAERYAEFVGKPLA